MILILKNNLLNEIRKKYMVQVQIFLVNDKGIFIISGKLIKYPWRIAETTQIDCSYHE